MLGQFCVAQEGLAAKIGSRSDFPRMGGMLAATGGAKLGRIVIAAAMNAAMVTAASALVMIRFPMDAALLAACQNDARRREKFTSS